MLLVTEIDRTIGCRPLGLGKLRDKLSCLATSYNVVNLPYGRMNKINMTSQTARNGVAQSTYRPFIGTGMSEEREVGIEHLVRFEYGNLDTQPVPSIREGCCCHSILLQPLIDLFYSIGSGRNESFSLIMAARQLRKRRAIMYTHLFFCKMSTIEATLRVADIV